LDCWTAVKRNPLRWLSVFGNSAPLAALPQTLDRLFLPRDHAAKHLWFWNQLHLCPVSRDKNSGRWNEKPRFRQQIAKTWVRKFTSCNGGRSGERCRTRLAANCAATRDRQTASPIAREDRNDHQHDAFSGAEWMPRSDLDGTLAGFLAHALAPAEREAAHIEGWILGIQWTRPAMPARAWSTFMYSPRAS